MAGLNLLRRLIVASLLTVTAFGFWGLLIVMLNTLLFLKQVGLADKYIQQAEEDQEAAFQKAFTLELLYTVGFWLLIILILPVYALVYGRADIIFPGFVLSLAVLGSVLHTPRWVFYRRMDFFRQRSLEAVDPLVGFLVTIPLALAGASYWSLVIGAVAGNLAGAVTTLIASPYRLAFRFDRGTLREYADFSWPLLIVSGSSLVVVQASVIVGEDAFGLAGVGIIGLVGIITLFVDQVDNIVTRTIYPAVCAVQDRIDVLFETFTKSNRLALMWGVPCGVGLTLFAPDFVEFLLGEKWRPAIGVLQGLGVLAALKQIGFNWTAFMRARGETRPMAISGVLGMATFLAVGVPMMFTHGVLGYIVGFGAMTGVQIISRAYFLTRLFPGFAMVRHVARAITPTIPAVAAVLILRAADSALDRTPALAAGELVIYVAVAAIATVLIERQLIREVWLYLRGGLRPAWAAPGRR